MSLLSSFNLQCTISPNNCAFIEDEKQLSYLQVLKRVNQLSYLIRSNIKQIDRVAIALDRGIDGAIAILSVLNIGCCYIPLDLKNPDNRLRYITDDADVQCIIGKGSCPGWLENQAIWVDINRLETVSENLPQTTSLPVNMESLAAILYTSGSTGNPKGVALSHRAMKNFSVWATETFKITHQDRIASLAPFHFDLSVFDLFSSLSRGSSVIFMPGNLTLSPSRLTTWLYEHEITVWYTVPSLLSFIALKGALSETPLPCLKTILFAGEVFPTQPLIKLCEMLPNVNFFNLFGPTETNVCCFWPVERNQLHAEQPIPIGIPACGSALKVIPETNELIVKSDNNLSGYWQQGQLIPALSHLNYYHTGDKVSINQLGEYCYHGRLDRMLKCSGYRVEPAEIEHKLQQCEDVEQCAVIGIKDATYGQRPVAALVLKTNAVLADIVKNIRQQLPAYMQPKQFVVLNALPYLANGKIDYIRLQAQLEKR